MDSTAVPRPTDGASALAYELDDKKTAIFAFVILGLILLVFVSIVLVDVYRKIRTGDFQDDMKGIGHLLLIVLKAPFRILAPMNFVALWYWFINLFRSKDSKKQRKGDEEVGQIADSAAVIERLNAKSVVSSSSDQGKSSSEPEKTIPSEDKTGDNAIDKNVDKAVEIKPSDKEGKKIAVSAPRDSSHAESSKTSSVRIANQYSTSRTSTEDQMARILTMNYISADGNFIAYS